MGASESTARPNTTNNNDDEPRPQPQNNNPAVGDAVAAVTAVATAAAGVAFAAYGISRMLSNNTETEETNRQTTLVEYQAAGNNNNINQRRTWAPPSPGGFKMNTDGACHPRNQLVQRGPSGFGGILRDHRGNWVLGFVGFIGESDALTSEFHGILKGLELLVDHNIQHAILETDCQAAFQWVTRQGDNRRRSGIVEACWSIIMRCRELVEENDIDVSLVHGDDANRCADKLANMGIARREVYVEMKDLPRELVSLVERDAQLING